MVLEPLDPAICPHGSILRREAGPGIPLSGLYCLDCGALVRRVAHKEYAPVGPVMDMAVLKDLRARIGLDRDRPTNIRLAPDAPGYATATERIK